MHKMGVTSHLGTNYNIFRPEGNFSITIGTIYIQAKFHTWEVMLAYPLILYQCVQVDKLIKLMLINAGRTKLRGS